MRRNGSDQSWIGGAQCRDCAIRHLVLFADLKEADFNLIHLPIENRRVATGAALYHAGDAGTSVFTVREGLLKLVQYTADGEPRIVRLLRPGAVAGLESLANEPYQHTAVALAPTRVCGIPRDVIDRLNRETPRLHRQLMGKWQASLKSADECLTALGTGTARQRVARLFLHLLGDGEDTKTRFLRRDDVGALLSVTTETACRTVAGLKREGIIIADGANQFRCDRAKLDAIANESRPALD